MFIKHWQLFAGSIAVLVAAGLIYTGMATSLPAQLWQFLAFNAALSFAVGALFVLAAATLACLIYGFGLEHTLGRSGDRRKSYGRKGGDA